LGFVQESPASMAPIKSDMKECLATMRIRAGAALAGTRQ
jgi:hypothetical protein